MNLQGDTRMKVINFPKSVDPVRKIREAALRRDLVCPFCHNMRQVDDAAIDGLLDLGSERRSIMFFRTNWTGQANGKPYFFKWGKDIRKWEKNICTCRKCGGRWEGDAYPIDICNIETRIMNS